jgi:hypothetical protein
MVTNLFSPSLHAHILKTLLSPSAETPRPGSAEVLGAEELVEEEKGDVSVGIGKVKERTYLRRGGTATNTNAFNIIFRHVIASPKGVAI